jgi:hypothetical protein
VRGKRYPFFGKRVVKAPATAPDHATSFPHLIAAFPGVPTAASHGQARPGGAVKPCQAAARDERLQVISD